MKRILTPFLILAAASSLLAQLTLHKVSLHAKSVAHGGRATTLQSFSATPMLDNEGDTYTHHTSTRHFTQTHRTTLECRLRNMGGEKETVRLQWFFFGASVQRGSKDVIIDAGEKEVSIEPKKWVDGTVTSAPTQTGITSVHQSGTPSFYNEQRGVYYSSSFRRTYSGVKIKGWVVRIVDKNEVVDAVGSTDLYRRLGHDSKELERMLSES